MVPLDQLFADARALAFKHLEEVDGIYFAPTMLPRIVKAQGITLRNEPFLDDPDFTGIAIYLPVIDTRVIIVNALLPPCRWCLTVAHELAHHVMDHQPPRRQIIERLANAYARELLMPHLRLVRQIREYGSNAEFLAGLNGVTVAAMRQRLQELGTSFACDDSESA